MGGFRSQPEITKNTIMSTGPGFSYASTNMCGWRLYMEDAHISKPMTDKKNFLFAVFDGHGGAQVSKFAEKHFLQQLQKNKHYKMKKYELALKQTFLKIDELLLSLEGKKQIAEIRKNMKQKGNGEDFHTQSQAGCTANVCLITPEMIYVANAGDSRSVCQLKKGDTKPLSYDHKPQNKLQLERVKRAGGQVSYGRINGNLNLSRALGDLEYKQNSKLSVQQQMITANPDIISIKNEGIDFIIMGCDGIWQVKSNEQMTAWIKERIQKNKEINLIVQELLDELLAKDSEGSEYGMDNMSAILIKFDKSKK